MGRAILLALLAALLAAPAAAHAVQSQAETARDWSQFAVRTPEGGVRIGNPAAPVHLVEYGSITSPHGAEFHAAAAAALRDQYVRTGKVSWEYRPFIIFPFDAGIFMLMNCLPTRDFFPSVDQLYASQRVWVGRYQSLTSAQRQRLWALAPLPRAAAMIHAIGLDAFFRAQGLPSERAAHCLSDRAGMQEISRSTQRGTDEGVLGAPIFFINGRIQSDSNWSSIDAGLRRASEG